MKGKIRGKEMAPDIIETVGKEPSLYAFLPFHQLAEGWERGKEGRN